MVKNDSKNLDELARDVEAIGRMVFHTDEGVYRASGGVEISIRPVVRDDGDLDQLGMAFVGLPVPSIVRGLPFTVRRSTSSAKEHESAAPNRDEAGEAQPRVKEEIIRVGCTDRRGQFRLTGLERGEYTVELEVATAKPASGKVDAQFCNAGLDASDEKRVEQYFHDENGSCQASLVLHHQVLRLVVEGKPEAFPDRLARYRVYDPDRVPLAQGYIGLYESQNKVFGRIQLATSLREKWTPDHYLEVSPQAIATLNFDELLEQSLERTEHPDCRQALDKAISEIRSRPPAAP